MIFSLFSIKFSVWHVFLSRTLILSSTVTVAIFRQSTKPPICRPFGGSSNSLSTLHSPTWSFMSRHMFTPTSEATFGNGGILRLRFRKTGRHIVALNLVQMCRLFYLKRANVSLNHTVFSCFTHGCCFSSFLIPSLLLILLRHARCPPRCSHSISVSLRGKWSERRQL